MRCTLAVPPRASHPACLRPSLRALTPEGAASRTLRSRLESVAVLRLLSWAGGTSELLARPVERGRLRGLGHLTARAHGTAFWLALWAAVAAAGVIALIPVLFDGDPPVPGNSVIHRLSGVSFAACGLVAWRRRPDSAVGPHADPRGLRRAPRRRSSPRSTPPLTFTVALLLGEVWIVVYAALILSFVSGGRLVSTVDRVLVGMFFVGLFVLQFAVMLFLDAGGQPAPRPARRRRRERADQGPAGRPDRRVARGRGRDLRRAGAPPRGRAGERCCRAWPGACPASCTPPR